MTNTSLVALLGSVILATSLSAEDLRVESPPGIDVKFVMLTAPFTISDLPGSNKEVKRLTAIVLNYHAENAPLTLDLDSQNVFVVLGNGKKLNALYFVVGRGWNVENTGKAGSMSYKELTVESGGSKQVLSAAGFESIKATCDCKENYAWFVFPIEDATAIAKASLGNVWLKRR